MSLLAKSLASQELFSNLNSMTPNNFGLQELLTTNWEQKGNFRASDIGVGGGKVWATGLDQGIYQRIGSQWTREPGAAVRVAVDGSGNPYVVNRGHGIYRWNASSNNWTQLPGAAWDVGVGFEGDLWVIGTNPVGGGYGIYHWVNNNWVNVPGGAVRIAVGPTGPWVVNSNGNIYEMVGNDWKQQPGCAHDVGVGPDGTVWVTGCDSVGGGNGIYRWNGYNGWDRTSGGATNVSVDLFGNPFVSNSNGNVYWVNS